MDAVKLTREIALTIIDGLYTGATIKDLCAVMDIPESTFYRMKDSDPILSDLYGRARRCYAEMKVDEIIGIADNTDDAAKARNMIDARKWSASKLMPQVYGDRIDLNVNTKLDLSAAIEEAKTRYLCATQAQAIETTARDITDDKALPTTGSEPVAPEKEEEPS